MSLQAMVAAFEVRGLTPSEKLVLLSLANYANKEWRCWPSQDTLAQETELSPRTVWTCLKRLGELNIVERVRRNRPDGSRSSDIFYLSGLAPTRNLCEANSQSLRGQLATVATLEEPVTEPVRKNQRAKSREGLFEGGEFEEFWGAYPNKVAKPAAQTAFLKAKKRVDFRKMMTALEAVKASEKWVKDDGKFVPNPATWLNQDRWNDPVTNVLPFLQPKPEVRDPWPMRMRSWQRQEGWNDVDWGPEPGEPGCLVPARYLRAEAAE